MRKRIYIAGKYSDDNIIGVLTNIRRGQEMAALLMRYGYSVFCPFLDYQFALTKHGEHLSKSDYQENSMAWVEVSDAMLVLPGWETSNGTRREIDRAVSLGIPVFHSLEDLRTYER
jgi:nucleoside 2-deoxyribosyltransferase